MRWAWGLVVLLGCGGSSETTPEQGSVGSGQETPAAVPTAPARVRRGVEVKGLEGTLQAYDVRETMERRFDALGACQQQRIRRVRQLAGRIELAIHVRTDGSVSQVDVVDSDLGDLETERCIAQVTLETKFPRPHGGEADVKWNMHLDPLSRGPGPEEREPDQLAEPLELSLPDAAEHCEFPRRAPPITITAYVAPSGKVLTAGASSSHLGRDELLACVANDVASWRLPRGKRVAKIRFEARYKRPLNDAQRQAIRKKHARRRKAEAKAAKRQRRAASRQRRRPQS